MANEAQELADTLTEIAKMRPLPAFVELRVQEAADLIRSQQVEIASLRAEKDRLQAAYDQLTGEPFSDRVHAALKDRAQRNEANAERYRWLRDSNATIPEEKCIIGGTELDELCDAGLAVTHTSGKRP